MAAAIDLTGLAHECGGHFYLVTELRDVTIGQSRIAVSQKFYRCDECNEERQPLEQIGDARRKAAALVRARERLLLPEQVRRIREERLHLTQAQFETALGLGAKTVVRWETGRVLHPKATDNLLRLLDRDPSALAFLAALNGIESLAVSRSAGSDSSAPVSGSNPSLECSLTIPLSCLSDLDALAAKQGVDARTFVAWTLAQVLAEAKLEHRLEGRVAAMHRDLAGKLTSLEEVWQKPRSEMRFPNITTAAARKRGSLPGLRTREPYAQSA